MWWMMRRAPVHYVVVVDDAAGAGTLCICPHPEAERGGEDGRGHGLPGCSGAS
jgi:hypothetical protein